MNEDLPLLMRRGEVIEVLKGRGLRTLQARRVLAAGVIPQAAHALHSQARWWRRTVVEFDVVAFLERAASMGGGKGEREKRG